MRRRNRNKSLFWYGVFARLQKFIGIVLVLIGMGYALFNIFIAILFIIGGIIILGRGASSEYDFQRQGGHIIYHG